MPTILWNIFREREREKERERENWHLSSSQPRMPLDQEAPKVNGLKEPWFYLFACFNCCCCLGQCKAMSKYSALDSAKGKWLRYNDGINN